MPSDAGRMLRILGFAQATAAQSCIVGLCAAAIRPLGARKAARAATTLLRS